MARQNKDLTSVFPSKNEEKYERLNSNNENISKDVILRDKSITDQQVEDSTVRTVEQVKSDLLSMYDEKTKKQTVEDTHQRTTFLFRKDLLKRLDKLAKGKRGFKTMFMNKAIEALLDEMEK